MSGSEVALQRQHRASPVDTGPGLRLAVPAIGTWLATAAMTTARPIQLDGAWWAAGGACTIGLAVALLSRSRGPQLLALFVAGCGLGLALGAGYLVRTQPPGLVGPVRVGAVASVDARITSDPRELASSREERSWLVHATALVVDSRGHRTTGHIPIVLMGRGLEHAAYGSSLRTWGRLGAPRAGSAELAILYVSGSPALLEPPGALARATARVRGSFRSAARGLPADSGALLAGLAIGDESQLSAELDAAMVRAGLAHLTAVSGSNTTLVMGLAIAIAAALGLGWRARIAFAVLVLAGFIALVRPQPSVLRAAAMGSVALVAMARGGRRNGISALSGAVLGLLVLYPQYATSLGFGLSVLATAGLLLVAAGLASAVGSTRFGRWLPPPVISALSVTAAATLATLPLSVAIGNGISLVAIPANLLAAPLVPAVTVLGLGVALTCVPLPGLAHVLAAVAGPAAGMIARIARVCSGLAGGVISAPSGWGGAILGLVLLGTLAALWISRPIRAVALRALPYLAAGAVVACGLRAVLPRRWPPPDWLVVACDVGQGDALVLRDPGPGPPTAVVVDTGPDPGALRKCLRALGVQRVEAVVLTHLHADHIDGLPAIRELWPARWPGSPVLVSDVAAAAAPAALASAGLFPQQLGQLHYGTSQSIGGLRIEVLWPARPVAESPENNSSLVLLATIPTPEGLAVRVLLSGDIEPEAQRAVMSRWALSGVDVVKLAHHGSAALVPGFVGWPRARIGLVSAGVGNDYGHPSLTTLAAYAAQGVMVGRTDAQGSLAVVSRDGMLGLVSQR